MTRRRFTLGTDHISPTAKFTVCVVVRSMWAFYKPEERRDM
jgi:hypothetical protein